MVNHGYDQKGRLMKKAFVLILKFTGGLFGLSVLIGVVWLVVDFHRYQAFHDPVHVPALSEYLAYYGEPKAMYRVDIGGTKFHGLKANIGNFTVTVSGPPIFLYGENGQWWDYTLNSGAEDFVRGEFGVGEIKWMAQVEEPVLLIQKIMDSQK